MTVVTKGRFAELCNVTPGRVSQWLAAGKISGDALVGEGRGQQIDVEKAQAQLKVKLDIDQRLSGNGLSTNLEAAAAAGPPINSVEQQIAEQRLIGLQRANREKATDEAVRLGQLVATDDARRQAGKEVAQVVARVEGALPELASAIAAKFKLPAREVVHELKQKWRQIRVNAAIEARERGEPLPERVGFDLDTDSEC